MLAPQKNQNPMWSNFGDRRVLNLQYNCLAVQAAASPRRRLKENVSEIVRSNGHIITIKIGVAGYNILNLERDTDARILQVDKSLHSFLVNKNHWLSLGSTLIIIIILIFFIICKFKKHKKTVSVTREKTVSVS